MIIVLLIFISYRCIGSLQPSAALVVLTAFDVLIVALTWLEYRRQRQIPEGSRCRRHGDQFDACRDQ